MGFSRAVQGQSEGTLSTSPSCLETQASCVHASTKGQTLVADDAIIETERRGAPTSSRLSSVKTRRVKVYERLMREWSEASVTFTPKPRPSHSRVLVRQRQNLTKNVPTHAGTNLWGSLPTPLSDTISPKAQSAWLAALLQRQLQRLAGIPMGVLIKQQTRLVPGSWVLAVPNHLTPEQAALSAVQGSCVGVHRILSPNTLTPRAGCEGGGSKRGDFGGQCTQGKDASAVVTAPAVSTMPAARPRQAA
ncbi:unnamed protein product [Discosporangium mesarthrocarpum]